MGTRIVEIRYRLCFKIVPELLRMSFRGCRRLSSDSLVGALAVIVVFFLHSRGFHERLLSFVFFRRN
jgi:hypothetical protein